MARCPRILSARPPHATSAAIRDVPLRVALLTLAVFAGIGLSGLPGHHPSPTLAATETVTLSQQESFDFETGEVDSLVGGHLYYLDDGLPRFWANNDPQAGVAHIGPAMAGRSSTCSHP